MFALCLGLMLTSCSGGGGGSSDEDPGAPVTQPSVTADAAAITSTLNAINSGNASSYSISGTCSGGSIVLKAESSSSAGWTTIATFACAANGTFAVTANFTPVADGNLTVELASSTNGSSLDSSNVLKDTVPPVGALLAPPPALNALTSIVSGVSTTDTSSYRFKVGPRSAIDCAVDAGYSAAVPVATAINENLALTSDGPIRLCLRAQDLAGNWQVTATVIDWTKDTTVPTATVTGLPAGDTNTASASGTVGGTGVTHYRMKFGLSGATTCSSSTGYGAETPVATPLSLTAANGDGVYKVCLIGKGSSATWQDFANATEVSWRYDSSGPSLAVSSPASGSVVPLANLSAYTVTTTCSEEGRTVSVTGTSAADSSQSTATGTCSGGSVSVTLNLSGRPDGTINVVATQTDAVGNSGSSTSVSIAKDTQAPTLSGTLADGTYSNSLSASPNLSWSAASDGSGSGIDHYQVAIGTTSGGTEVLGWTDLSNITSYQRTGLSLTSGATYFPQVRAVDRAGNTSSALIGDGWIVDVTAPNISTVTLTLFADDWSTSQSPVLNWTTATDTASGVAAYQVAIGTAAGLSDVKAWTSVGNVTTTTVTGLTLTRGSTYYASVRAVDQVGNISTIVQGANGWSVNQNLWMPNGSVSAMAKLGSTLYLGGAFTKMQPYTGSGVPVSATNGTITWADFKDRARVIGVVYSAVPDGDGGFFIGGFFKRVGRAARNNLAHVLADGTVDPAFNPDVNDAVYSVARVGTTLYFGGVFTAVGGAARNYLSAVSTTDGALIGGFTLQPDATVSAITASGSTLYIAGSFTTVGGISRGALAAISLADHSLVPGFNPGLNNTAYSLIVSGTVLYLGGSFTTVGGVAQPYLAAVSTTDGALVAGFRPLLDSDVYTMALSGSTLYVGGSFTKIGATTKPYLAALSTTDGSLVGAFSPNPNSQIDAVAVSGTSVYAGGAFTTIGGGSQSRMAAVSTADGSLISGFAPDINRDVYSLTVSGSTLYIGGWFSAANGVTRNSIAAISMVDGTLVTGFNPNANGTVSALALSGSTLYLGGIFTQVGGTTRNRIAAVSASDGTLVTGFNPNANGTVSALAVSGSTLYLGGGFTQLGTTTRNRIAALSASDGTLVTGFDPNANGTVYALAVSGSTLYLGGGFTQLGTTTRNRIAALSVSDGSLVTGFNPNANGNIYAVVVSGSKVYLGGGFTQVGGTTKNRLAAVSASDGTLDSTFNPSVVGGSVKAVAVSNSTVYLGGSFNTVNGTTKPVLAAVSISDGALDTAFQAGASSTVDTLLFAGSALYLGGIYTGITGVLSPGWSLPNSYFSALTPGGNDLVH